MRRLMIVCLIILLILPSTLAVKSGHIFLLAVSTTEGENETGSIADLYLEIKPGTGRVFLDTYPLTKLDTQFSTRLAHSIACEYAEKDCKTLDFFYTIKSRSTIIGGPSAGAAVTILTISLLNDEKIPQDIAITGTINSGGIIGPIAGVIAKVKAAQDEGLKTVLIPKINVGNSSDIEQFLNTTTISVIRVSSIDDAMYSLTGKKKGKNVNLEVNTVFTDTMNEIAKTLCNATKMLRLNGTNTSYEKKGDELYELSVNASKSNAYYSQASFCFGANVQFRMLDLKNKTNPELIKTFNKIKKDIENFENTVDNRDINTIDDLQTYMIVKERLKDAKEYITETEKNLSLTNLSSDSIAYSIERYNSALTWSRFFGTGNKEYIVNKESQKIACMDKISEVQGYVQYISLYIDFPLVNIEKDIDETAKDIVNGDYALCISKASKAKAEASIILEALSVSREQMNELFDQKIEIAKQSIISQQEKGAFPILGYSYYEYAKTLKDTDPDSAQLYVGYSIELSNLDVYFEKKNSNFKFNIDYGMLLTFSLGFIFGIILMILIRMSRHKNTVSVKIKNRKFVNRKKN
jgi:uncharacterized protein